MNSFSLGCDNCGNILKSTLGKLEADEIETGAKFMLNVSGLAAPVCGECLDNNEIKQRYLKFLEFSPTFETEMKTNLVSQPPRSKNVEQKIIDFGANPIFVILGAALCGLAFLAFLLFIIRNTGPGF